MNRKNLHWFFLTPSATSSGKAWFYFYRFFEGFKTKLVLTSVGSVIQAGLIIPVLLLVKYVFDHDIPEKQAGHIILTGMAIIGLRLFTTLVSLLIRRVNIRIMSGFVFRIREHLMHRIYSFNHAFYSGEDQRVLQSRIVEDTERIANMGHSVVSGILPAVMISLGLTAILAFLNWMLFLIIAGLFPLILLTSRFYARMTRRKVFEFQRSFEGFSKVTSFVMKFMDLIRIQSTETIEKQKHTDILDDLKEKTEEMTYAFSVSGQVQNFLVGTAGILVLVAGGISVIGGQMTLGGFFAFYIAASQLQNNINLLTSAYTTVVAGNTSLVTLYEIAARNEPEPYHGQVQISFNQKISLSLVSFRYGDTPVLRDISLDILKGESTAIIGQNGAGKTTLIRLLLGFYAPVEGRISLDDIPYSEIDFSHFRRSVGVVLQHPPLIPGTIRENILYGNPGCSDAELEDATKAALAFNFIKTMPSGFDTQVGEDGVLLSGGERQMVALARALIRKPGLLILDEPTNHLDHHTVGLIMQNLVSLEYRPAVLLISHNRDVIRHANKIFLLENGTGYWYNHSDK